MIQWTRDYLGDDASKRCYNAWRCERVRSDGLPSNLGAIHQEGPSLDAKWIAICGVFSARHQIREDAQNWVLRTAIEQYRRIREEHNQRVDAAISDIEASFKKLPKSVTKEKCRGRSAKSRPSRRGMGRRTNPRHAGRGS